MQDDYLGGHRHGHQTLDPNQFRRIDENSYDDPNAPVADSPSSNAEATMVRHGIGSGSLSSAETFVCGYRRERTIDGQQNAPTKRSIE